MHLILAIYFLQIKQPSLPLVQQIICVSVVEKGTNRSVLSMHVSRHIPQLSSAWHIVDRFIETTCEGLPLGQMYHSSSVKQKTVTIPFSVLKANVKELKAVHVHCLSTIPFTSSSRWRLQRRICTFSLIFVTSWRMVFSTSVVRGCSCHLLLSRGC